MADGSAKGTRSSASARLSSDDGLTKRKEQISGSLPASLDKAPMEQISRSAPAGKITGDDSIDSTGTAYSEEVHEFGTSDVQPTVSSADADSIGSEYSEDFHSESPSASTGYSNDSFESFTPPTVPRASTLTASQVAEKHGLNTKTTPDSRRSAPTNIRTKGSAPAGQRTVSSAPAGKRTGDDSIDSTGTAYSEEVHEFGTSDVQPTVSSADADSIGSEYSEDFHSESPSASTGYSNDSFESITPSTIPTSSTLAEWEAAEEHGLNTQTTPDSRRSAPTDIRTKGSAPAGQRTVSSAPAGQRTVSSAPAGKRTGDDSIDSTGTAYSEEVHEFGTSDVQPTVSSADADSIGSEYSEDFHSESPSASTGYSNDSFESITPSTIPTSSTLAEWEAAEEHGLNTQTTPDSRRSAPTDIRTKGSALAGQRTVSSAPAGQRTVSSAPAGKKTGADSIDSTGTAYSEEVHEFGTSDVQPTVSSDPTDKARHDGDIRSAAPAVGYTPTPFSSPAGNIRPLFDSVETTVDDFSSTSEISGETVDLSHSRSPIESPTAPDKSPPPPITFLRSAQQIAQRAKETVESITKVEMESEHKMGSKEFSHCISHIKSIIKESGIKDATVTIDKKNPTVATLTGANESGGGFKTTITLDGYEKPNAVTNRETPGTLKQELQNFSRDGDEKKSIAPSNAQILMALATQAASKNKEFKISKCTNPQTVMKAIMMANDLGMTPKIDDPNVIKALENAFHPEKLDELLKKSINNQALTNEDAKKYTGLDPDELEAIKKEVKATVEEGITISGMTPRGPKDM